MAKKLPMRLRKFIGLLVLLGWIFVYTIFIIGLAIRVLPGAHWAVQLLFYAGAGMAWIVPVRYLFQWMSAPDEDPEQTA